MISTVASSAKGRPEQTCAPGHRHRGGGFGALPRTTLGASPMIRPAPWRPAHGARSARDSAPFSCAGSCSALSISANVVLLEAVLAVPCRPRFLWFGRFFTHSDCRGTGIGADRGSAAQRALGEGHASGACSSTTTAGCSRCFSGSAGASGAGASLPPLRRQTWP